MGIFRNILVCAGLFAAALCDAAVFEVVDSVLIIPPKTKKIEAGQFADRTDFHSVEFAKPCSLASIGDHAFMGCTSLRSIDLPISLQSIGEGAFSECSSLTRIVLPRLVKAVPKQAFSWCSSLKEVTLSPSVSDIGSHAFAYCTALEQINFPTGLLHIGSNAFSFCTALTVVRLPARIKELESYAFAECSSLRRTELPANSHMLGELIFSGCRKLMEIVEMSPVPPTFDCNSTLFDPEEDYMYETCRLIVLPKSVAAYRNAQGWNLFRNVN